MVHGFHISVPCKSWSTLWDSPHRFGGAYELYFKHIIPLLWSIYDGISLETSDIPNDFISYIPTLEQFGVIGRTEDKLCIKIPVLKKTDYDEMCALIKNATEEIKAVIGEEFTTFITSLKNPIPKHLTSVHIAKLNGRICGAKRSHSVSEQPNCYQSV